MFSCSTLLVYGFGCFPCLVACLRILFFVLFACLFACLFVCLPCLFAYLLDCLLVCLFACFLKYVFVLRCQSTGLLVFLACLFYCLTCLLVCLFACVFVCLLVCLFACLLDCLFVCLLAWSPPPPHLRKGKANKFQMRKRHANDAANGSQGSHMGASKAQNWSSRSIKK